MYLFMPFTRLSFHSCPRKPDQIVIPKRRKDLRQHNNLRIKLLLSPPSKRGIKFTFFFPPTHSAQSYAPPKVLAVYLTLLQQNSRPPITEKKPMFLTISSISFESFDTIFCVLVKRREYKFLETFKC